MSSRRLPIAAGLVVLHLALVQTSMILPTLLQLGLDVVKEPIGLGALIAVLGLVAVGGAAVAERRLAIPLTVWLVGCAIAIVGFAHETGGGSGLFVATAQQVGGPVLVILLARTVPVSSTPLRRELGAALVVLGIGGALSAGWSYASTLRLFVGSTWSASSIAGSALYPAVGFLTSALAVRAGRQMLRGRETASRALAQWMWIAIATQGALAVLAFATYMCWDHDVPRWFAIQPLVGFALSSVTPLVFGHLGRRALALPIDPRDELTVPTVFAWAAAWLVPTFVCAAFLVRTSFVAELVNDASTSRAGIVSAGCALTALVLLGTALSVLRAAPIARVFVRVAAMLSLCGLCWLAYFAWTLGNDRHNYMGIAIPVGAVALFTTAMMALAWFEARRGHDLAPARIVE